MPAKPRGRKAQAAPKPDRRTEQRRRAARERLREAEAALDDAEG